MFSDIFANRIARELLSMLEPDCDKVTIVGSLRRGLRSVNDIDILAIPRFARTDNETLFGEKVIVNLLDLRLAELCLDAYLVLEAKDKKMTRVFWPANNVMIPIDIYEARESDWWILLLLLTGGRKHNFRLLTRAAELNMNIKADGSCLLSECGEPLNIKCEEDIFRCLQLPYLPPEERE
jgi:DNA polymerase/3'-5' exonuclease PolX